MAGGSCGDLASQGSDTSDLGGGRCARLGSPSGLRCACPQPPGGGHEWLADVPPAPSSRNGAEPRALTVLRSPRRHLPRCLAGLGPTPPPPTPRRAAPDINAAPKPLARGLFPGHCGRPFPLPVGSCMCVDITGSDDPGPSFAPLLRPALPTHRCRSQRTILLLLQGEFFKSPLYPLKSVSPCPKL